MMGQLNGTRENVPTPQEHRIRIKNACLDSLPAESKLLNPSRRLTEIRNGLAFIDKQDDYIWAQYV